MAWDDHLALRAAAGGAALCTLVSIDGSFSRRLGAQLAVGADGTLHGSLSDGCLENELASEVADARGAGGPRLRRYGAGSPKIDFRLPCGSGLDVLINPAPDRAACTAALARLDAREPANLALALPGDAAPSLLAERHYIPPLRLLAFGEGPELTALARMARAAGIAVETRAKEDAGQAGLALGQAPEGLTADPWTAIVLLFHDHEWEDAILRWALDTPAFHIGAQGGRAARDDRIARLSAEGVEDARLGRIVSPVGTIPHVRDPSVLAVSILAEIMGAYDRLHPHR